MRGNMAKGCNVKERKEATRSRGRTGGVGDSEVNPHTGRKSIRST